MNDLEVAARGICSRLREAGFRALFAGGCVRDRLRGERPKDIDIATSARPEEIVRLFPKTFRVGAAFGVVIVVDGEHQFEVATFRKDGPYLDGRRPSQIEFSDEVEDAQRRDFTVNALFYDPEKDVILDYIGGQSDLREGLLRCVGDARARFSEDHLRLLRAVRFAARFRFHLHPDTRDAIVAGSLDILKTSPERIRDELVHMLTEGYAHDSLQLLDETGLLGHVLPEIIAMKGVEQPPEFHPEGDVFVHTMLLMKHLPPFCSLTLAFGALLHDVGKPVTQTFEDRIRFNQHDKIGADIAQAICRRMRFSNEETNRIVWLVAQHMRLAALPEMKESKRKRFAREPGFLELLELARLDCLASHGDRSTIRWIEDYLSQTVDEAMTPPPLLTGSDLIAMGYPPGPAFKEILRAVEDGQLEGQLDTTLAAKVFVRQHFSPETPSPAPANTASPTNNADG